MSAETPTAVDPHLSAPATPLAVFRGASRRAVWTLILALGAIAAAAWYLTWVGGNGMSSSMLVATAQTGGSLGLLLFLAIWLGMMVAMMYPAAAPMVQAYVRLAVTTTPAPAGRAAQTAVFLAVYTAVWTAVGLSVAAAYFLLGPRLPVLAATGTLGVPLAGAVLVVAGLYQTTPLKQVCLDGCRSPFSFLATDYRPGNWGAARLGLRHSAYCIGCCWLLFAVLFAVGLMAIFWMALLALFIFVEKLFAGRIGFRLSLGLGGAMSAVGVSFLVLPMWGAWALGIA